MTTVANVLVLFVFSGCCCLLQNGLRSRNEDAQLGPRSKKEEKTEPAINELWILFLEWSSWKARESDLKMNSLQCSENRPGGSKNTRYVSHGSVSAATDVPHKAQLYLTEQTTTFMVFILLHVLTSDAPVLQVSASLHETDLSKLFLGKLTFVSEVLEVCSAGIKLIWEFSGSKWEEMSADAQIKLNSSPGKMLPFLWTSVRFVPGPASFELVSLFRFKVSDVF